MTSETMNTRALPRVPRWVILILLVVLGLVLILSAVTADPPGGGGGGGNGPKPPCYAYNSLGRDQIITAISSGEKFFVAVGRTQKVLSMILIDGGTLIFGEINGGSISYGSKPLADFVAKSSMPEYANYKNAFDYARRVTGQKTNTELIGEFEKNHQISLDCK